MENQDKREQINKVLIKASSLEKGKEIGLAREFISLDEKIEKISTEIDEKLGEIKEELKKKLENELVLEIDREELKGDKGDCGECGEQGEKGEKGEQGEAGKDGKDGIDGLDGKDGLDGQNGLSGANGSPDTPKEIKEKLETLKKDERLDKSAIKGLEETLQENIDRAISILDQRTQFLINKVSNIQNSITNGVRTINTNTLLDDSFIIIMVSGLTTITLPTAVGIQGKTYNIIRVGTEDVTIQPSLGQTISGDGNLILTSQWDSIVMASDGANWIRIS